MSDSKRGFKSPAKFQNLKSFDSLLGFDQEEQMEQLPLSQLRSFEEHPFLVLDDVKMGETVASIRENGVLVPIIVRPVGRDQYEIVSGHRRVHACTYLKMETIPALVREMDQETATIFMVDSNIQREELRLSEKAFAYKMKYEAMKQQGKRTDTQEESTVGSPDGSPEESPEGSTADVIGQAVGESGRQVKRYIRLTYLNVAFLALIDGKKLSFLSGVALSFLESDQQAQVLEVMEEKGVVPSVSQSEALKKSAEKGTFTKAEVERILGKVAVTKGFRMKQDISSYFPEDMNQKEREDLIISLLEEWSKSQG